ncbi:3-methyladenine DNA glycosylase [Opitutaceae bacterium EW11]|nr:3-methyladenine DNA glycosylase [Opitutaceae bacterium EW11]
MGDLIRANEYAAKSTVSLARDLIGKVLVRGGAGRPVSRHLITETEAYHSENDLACHARKGRTPRTDVLFRAAGIWYVYLCYGVHEMLNLVVGPEGFPAAILIRGLHDVSGPGRLTKALGIGRQINGLPAEPATGLWLEDDGVAVSRRLIEATPRIGVDYAGEIWAAKPWRFVLTDAGRDAALRRWRR